MQPAKMLNITELEDQDLFAFNIHDDREEILRHAGDRMLSWKSALEVSWIYEGFDSFATYIIDGKRYDVKPGEVHIANLESLESLLIDEKRIRDTGRPKILILQYSKRMLQHCCGDAGIPVFRVNASDSLDMNLAAPVLERIADYAENTPEDPNHLLIEGLGLELLYYLIRDCTEDRKDTVQETDSYRRQHAAITDTITYINDHYGEKLTLKNIAERQHFHPDYFSRIFKQNTGMTLASYILNRRLSNARKQLLTGDVSLSDIAMDCGFQSIRYFITAFRRAYGTSPGAYRRDLLRDMSKKLNF